jgi:hypothetical protein
MKLTELVNLHLFVPTARQHSFFSCAGFYSFTTSTQVLLRLIINLSSYSWVGSEQKPSEELKNEMFTCSNENKRPINLTLSM